MLVVLVLLLVACGGGNGSSGDDLTATPNDVSAESGDGQPTEGTIVSSDGVLTVDIPEGAAPAGTVVTIVELDETWRPEQLQVADVSMAAYDLLPDGAVFAEPVTITYRIDPNDLGLELLDGAVPVALLVTQDESGELGMVGVELSRENGMFVARASTTHFSPFAIMISDTSAIALVPPALALAVGGQERVELRKVTLTGSELLGARLRRNELWTATAPFVAETIDPLRGAWIECSAPTDGVVPDAYILQILKATGSDVQLEAMSFLISQLGLLHTTEHQVTYTLSGSGTCTLDGTDPIGDPFSSSGSSATEDPTADAVDIVEISHRQVDLTTHEFTVHLGGPGEVVAKDLQTSLFQLSGRIDGVEPWPNGGWDFTIVYANGVIEPVTVLSRSVEDGEPTTTRVGGASADINWTSAQEVVITVFNIEVVQPVEGFVIATSTSNRNDEATCHEVCLTN